MFVRSSHFAVIFPLFNPKPLRLIEFPVSVDSAKASVTAKSTSNVLCSSLDPSKAYCDSLNGELLLESASKHIQVAGILVSFGFCFDKTNKPGPASMRKYLMRSYLRVKKRTKGPRKALLMSTN